ncbi:DEAD/DEAH box helicase [Nocardia aurea]|uniref:DEAD/DEAH box helicase n=1 Tax=Nocardia aurea TaxID=2144174 RepID=UPI003F4B8EE2
MTAELDDTHTAPKFAELGVRDEIVRALGEIGIERTFAIQELTLPLALAGEDLIGQARTGMGKTFGFGVPLLHRIATADTGTTPLDGTPRALVIVPTRELCIQVTSDLENASKYLTNHQGPLKVASIYGGRPYESQIAALRAGVDVVVGTPGRLLDLANQNHLILGKVGVLVLDEADEMLDLGFLPDIERILSMVPDKRQTMLFSATMPGPIITLARTFLTRPTHIRAEEAHDSAIHDRTTQFVYRAHALDKHELIAKVLQAEGRGATMIFTRTKRTAQKVADELADRGFAVGAVHGDLGQIAREKALNKFRKGVIDVLVATDVAARGIDIDDVTHVVNYQCPEDEKTYVHRIGRTGRAGRTGVAITLIDWDELNRWAGIDKALGLGIPDPVETYSRSPHLLSDLGIPEGTTGHVRKAKPVVREEEAEVVERPARAPRKRNRRRTRAGEPIDGVENSGTTGGENGVAENRVPENGGAETRADASVEGTAEEGGQPRRRRRRRRSGGDQDAAANNAAAEVTPTESAEDSTGDDTTEQPARRRRRRRRPSGDDSRTVEGGTSGRGESAAGSSSSVPNTDTDPSVTSTNNGGPTASAPTVSDSVGDISTGSGTVTGALDAGSDVPASVNGSSSTNGAIVADVAAASVDATASTDRTGLATAVIDRPETVVDVTAASTAVEATTVVVADDSVAEKPVRRRTRKVTADVAGADPTAEPVRSRSRKAATTTDKAVTAAADSAAETVVAPTRSRRKATAPAGEASASSAAAESTTAAATTTGEATAAAATTTGDAIGVSTAKAAEAAEAKSAEPASSAVATAEAVPARTRTRRKTAVTEAPTPVADDAGEPVAVKTTRSRKKATVAEAEATGVTPTAEPAAKPVRSRKKAVESAEVTVAGDESVAPAKTVRSRKKAVAAEVAEVAETGDVAEPAEKTVRRRTRKVAEAADSTVAESVTTEIEAPVKRRRTRTTAASLDAAANGAATTASTAGETPRRRSRKTDGQDVVTASAATTSA